MDDDDGGETHRCRHIFFHLGITSLACLIMLGLWSGLAQEWWPCVTEWLLYNVIMVFEAVVPFVVIAEPYLVGTMLWIYDTMSATGLTSPTVIEALVALMAFTMQYGTVILSISAAYLIIGMVAPFPASIQLSRLDEETDGGGGIGPLHLIRPSVSNGYAMYTRA